MDHAVPEVEVHEHSDGELVVGFRLAEHGVGLLVIVDGDLHHQHAEGLDPEGFDLGGGDLLLPASVGKLDVGDLHMPAVVEVELIAHGDDLVLPQHGLRGLGEVAVAEQDLHLELLGKPDDSREHTSALLALEGSVDVEVAHLGFQYLVFGDIPAVGALVVNRIGHIGHVSHHLRTLRRICIAAYIVRDLSLSPHLTLKGLSWPGTMTSAHSAIFSRLALAASASV